MSDKSDVIPSERPDVTIDTSNNTPDIQDNTSSNCNSCINAKDANATTTYGDDPSKYRIKHPPDSDSNSNISEEEEVQLSSSEQLSKNKNNNEGNGSPSASGRSVPPHNMVPLSSSLASPKINNNDDEDNDVENGTNYNPSPRMKSTTTRRRECFHWWLPCLTWSRQRIIVAILGCFSSSVVLAIRLILDNNPTTTYKIHSVIIFLDMVLIHLFTYSKWLSFSGEALTVGMALSYTYTHETIFEFIETTMIAVLCSFHMILSRNKHWEHESQLQDELASLRDSIRSLHDGSHDHLMQSLPSSTPSTHNAALINRRNSSRNSSTLSRALYSNSGNTSNSNDANGSSLILPHHHNELQQQHHHRKNNARMHLCCGHFFEHFLDGSAGVMYTSFLGLIIDEAINYGSNKCG